MQSQKVEAVGLEPTWADFQSAALTIFATLPKWWRRQESNLIFSPTHRPAVLHLHD